MRCFAYVFSCAVIFSFSPQAWAGAGYFSTVVSDTAAAGGLVCSFEGDGETDSGTMVYRLDLTEADHDDIIGAWSAGGDAAVETTIHVYFDPALSSAVTSFSGLLRVSNGADELFSTTLADSTNDGSDSYDLEFSVVLPPYSVDLGRPFFVRYSAEATIDCLGAGPWGAYSKTQAIAGVTKLVW